VRDKKLLNNTKPLIWAKMYTWEVGKHVALVKDVEEAAQEDGWGMPHN